MPMKNAMVLRRDVIFLPLKEREAGIQLSEKKKKLFSYAGQVMPL